MKNKTKSMPNGELSDRVAELEENVAKISQTVYDLIDTLQRIPDPPCPPMCSLVEEEYSGKKKRSRRKH
ncbi:MAG TPA: hypothetical protein VE135_12530 [Pyrinomonadaceae bacterium]|nr:hypothetical protein [Pyrinomonadaceae bacterium]